MKHNDHRNTTKACLKRHAFVLMLAAAGFAFAQEPWELRICTDPDAWPFSSEESPGFENVIAQSIADELGARVTFDWTPQGSNMVRDRLNGGECDVIAGVPDEIEGVLHTVSYYTSPYVFVVPDSSALAPDLTLDSPALADLRIGVQVTSLPPHEALLNRGLHGQIVFEGLDARAGGRPDAVLQELEAGNIDVALAWGPVVGGWLLDREGYSLIPVTPMIEPPFLQQVVPMTMAVRQGDVSLRDDLNSAIAARWDEVQATLAGFGVPVTQAVAPRVTESAAAPVTFALVAPADLRPAPVSVALHSLVGEAAHRGARLAAEELLRADSAAPELLVAVAPNGASAVRAAGRLHALHQPAALLGGIGPGQLEALLTTGLPVVNIGEPVTGELPDVTHAQATVEMYMEALVRWHSADRWFVLHEDSAEGAALADAFVQAVHTRGDGATVTGQAAVAPAEPYFGQVISAAAEDAQAVAVLLDPRDQLSFLAQAAGSPLTVALYPHAVTQSRDFLATASERGSGGADTEMITYFEPTSAVSAELAESFAARWGMPMEPAAYSAWQGVHWIAAAIGRREAELQEGVIACASGDELALPVVRLVANEMFERSLERTLSVAEEVGDVRVGCSVGLQR